MSSAFRPSMPRLLLALLMLAIRLAAAVMPMPAADPVRGPSDAVAALLGAQTICHAGNPQDAGPHRQDPAHPADHGHDCGICPICHVMATPILAAAAAALAPPPGVAATAPAALPPATGPPQVLRTAASPRGPPTRSV
jgi:hypothetical protein